MNLLQATGVESLTGWSQYGPMGLMILTLIVFLVIYYRDSNKRHEQDRKERLEREGKKEQWAAGVRADVQEIRIVFTKLEAALEAVVKWQEGAERRIAENEKDIVELRRHIEK